MAVDKQISQHSPDPELEYRALKRCLTPMETDTDRRVLAKIVGLVLVLLWSAITLAVSFDAAVVPPHWLPFTALVFLIVGRLWSIEVEQLLPGSYGSNQRDQPDTDDDSDSNGS